MNARSMAPLLGAVLLLVSAEAAALTFSGRFDDLANRALLGSDLGLAGFADDAAIANNVALYELRVPVAGVVTVIGDGLALGGADPYFTLFEGPGRTATFVDSSYAQAFSTGGDVVYAASLAAGVYQIAIGVFANLSFAENLGSGTLADGFIGWGSASSLGNYSYGLSVTTPVPEVSVRALLALGLLALGIRCRRPAVARNRFAPAHGSSPTDRTST